MRGRGMSDAIVPDRQFVAALGPALVGTLGVFVLMQAVGLSHAGGAFEYPLDDVYIHLAMAEQLAQGGYGVNAGEYASASSSILYTFLLTPFAGTELHRYMPLLWNAVAVTASGVFWAMLVARAVAAGLAPWTQALVAGVVPIFLNIAAVAMTGMEHGLHTAVCLMLLVGLIDMAVTGRLNWLLIAGVVLGPTLRFEGLALSLLSCAAVWQTGLRRQAVMLALASVAPVVLFVAALLAMGLEPLPSSIIVKLGLEEGEGGPANLFGRIGQNLRHEPAFALTALAAVGFWAAMRSRQGNRKRATLVATVVGGAALAHLAFGKFGWMDRYENYIIVTMTGGAIWLAVQVGGATPRLILTVAAMALSFSFFPNYLKNFLVVTQYAPQSVLLQHGEMARFAQDYARVPVAVNDLGRVAYRNPDYTLDLWGLASPEARILRLDDERPQGWADGPAKAHGVKLAMIYDRWLPQAAHPGWVRLGTLRHLTHRGMLAGTNVNFYATDAATAPALRAALAEYAKTLPDGVAFDAAPGDETEDRDVAD